MIFTYVGITCMKNGKLQLHTKPFVWFQKKKKFQKNTSSPNHWQWKSKNLYDKWSQPTATMPVLINPMGNVNASGYLLIFC